VGALGEVYDRHAVALLRFAARAASQHEAEDLVQATFVRVVQIAARYDGRSSSARSWLIGITARLIQERRRSLTRFSRALTRLAEIAEISPHGALTNDSARTDLERGLATLSEAKRLVVVLAEIEEYTCEEIARMLEVPVGTVWTRLHHARKELRSFYSSGGQ
jgi:RNA polymerase sigma-70 factor (ECF subfamily)